MNFNLSLYGLIYALGFILFWFVDFPKCSKGFTYRLYVSIFASIGAIVGGRLCYVFLYEPYYYLHNLLEILQIYKGGMSFHGGVIGIITAVFIADKRLFWQNLDRAAVVALIVLPLGRIVNFINGELWGTVTNLPWGVIFLGADLLPRHPVQLYEAIAEGPLLAFILFLMRSSFVKRGDLACYFALWYAVLRFVTEFFREPDLPVGYVIGNISLGQILCLVQFIVVFIILKRKSDALPGLKTGASYC